MSPDFVLADIDKVALLEKPKGNVRRGLPGLGSSSCFVAHGLKSAGTHWWFGFGEPQVPPAAWEDVTELGVVPGLPGLGGLPFPWVSAWFRGFPFSLHRVYPGAHGISTWFRRFRSLSRPTGFGGNPRLRSASPDRGCSRGDGSRGSPPRAGPARRCDPKAWEEACNHSGLCAFFQGSLLPPALRKNTVWQFLGSKSLN